MNRSQPTRRRQCSPHPRAGRAPCRLVAGWHRVSLRVGYVRSVPSTHRRASLVEHAPQNAMDDPDEIERFYDRCSELMRELLDGLAGAPDRPRPFPDIEDAIGWPQRRIASVLGGVSRLRHSEFGGRRPYHFQDSRASASGRWELWMDGAQADAVRAVQRS